ncbi:hypothetical protein GCM10010219_13700 [Streptomyces netropsis]|nr:hypothetical protein GCM10010219_13700 [Streptomyces netropsis]
MIRSTRSARRAVWSGGGAELSAASSACAGLLARIERAVQDGELVAGTHTAALTGLVQPVVHGLSVRPNLG